LAKKLEVMNIRLDNYPMRESMVLVETFLNNSVLNTIEEISRPMIVEAAEQEDVKKCIESLDLAIPANREIYVEAGLREDEYEDGNSFFYEFAKRVIRDEKKVLLLGADAQGIARVEKFLAQGYGRMQVIGTLAMEDYGEEADVINEINILMPDVILSVLPSPQQEYFLLRQRERLHAKVWYGIDKEYLLDQGSSGPKRTFRRMLRRLSFRRYMAEFKKNEADL